MIWAKTDAGRAEMLARSLVKDRAQRNLLLIIDGKTQAEKLLAGLAGISPMDFTTLESLGLITPVAPPVAAPAPPAPASSDTVDIDVSGHDYATLRGSIGLLISRELGMRGLTMSMVLEEAASVDDLKEIAQRVLKQIADRKGPVVAAAARKFLLGS